MRESVTYQAILEEGEASGLAKGKAEGALVEARKILLRLGQSHLGTPDAKAVLALERITDLNQLEELCDRVRAVDSWRKLLGGPAAGRSRRHRPG